MIIYIYLKSLVHGTNLAQFFHPPGLIEHNFLLQLLHIFLQLPINPRQSHLVLHNIPQLHLHTIIIFLEHIDTLLQTVILGIIALYLLGILLQLLLLLVPILLVLLFQFVDVEGGGLVLGLLLLVELVFVELALEQKLLVLLGGGAVV